MPTRTVSTVSTVRALRYGGSTLRYGLYGRKYLLATMPTTVPTTMPTTRTVSTVSTVRTLRYGGSTLQYGLYGTKYLLLLYGTVSKTPISWYPGTSWWRYLGSTTRYELASLQLHVLNNTLPSSPDRACVAAQGHHRPRGSFSAVCAAQRQQKPWDFALPAARRHRRAIPQRRGVPSSCGDPAAAAARARQCKTSPSRLPRLSRTPRTRLGCWQPSSRQRPRMASPASTRRTPGSTHRQI